MNGLVIALDFDGVMYPLTDAVNFYWRSNGRPFVVPDPCTNYAFWRDAGMTDDEWEAELLAFGEADGYRLAAPYPEALVGVTALFDAGCGLIGVTSRPHTPAVVRSTYGFVADNYLPLRSVHIGPISKLEAEFDLLIEDNPAELDRLHEIGEASGLLIAQPYNVGAPWPRVSWEELPALVDALAAEVAGVADTERRDVLADALEGMVGA